MKLFTAKQIRSWDEYTISHEPVTSAELMERAATACTRYLLSTCNTAQTYYVFCGQGNNGGDGLCIARMLTVAGAKVSVFIFSGAGAGSPDFVTNLEKLVEIGFSDTSFIEDVKDFPRIPQGSIVVDALLGTGLTKPVSGLLAQLIENINNCGCPIVSVDIPSGLPADMDPALLHESRSIVRATVTLSFQQPKVSFLFASTGPYAGRWEILDIGLHPVYYKEAETDLYYVDRKFVLPLLRSRLKFSHKGNFGHALLIGGSYGKMGAVILASEACLKSGAGLVTAFIPRVGYTIIQTALPEAMVLCDDAVSEISAINIETAGFGAIGIGPGLGQQPVTKRATAKFISECSIPMVIDADALNISAQALTDDPDFRFPVNAILTPHPGEFERLAGPANNDHERFLMARQFAVKHNIYLVLKGAHTVVCTPEGKCYFNSTGNPGMATGGSGDVLTGIITALLAQGYPPSHAAVLGVYIHGFAGDRAAEQLSQESLIASDISASLHHFFSTHHHA